MQEQIPSDIHALILSAAHDQDLATARAVLLTAGLKSQQLSSGTDGNGCSLKVFLKEKNSIQQLYHLFRRLNLPGINVQAARLKPKDWLTRWKNNWKPVRLTKRLDVVPVWHKQRYRPVKGRDFILMDTLLSFGTGLHETTRFMAQLIEGLKGKFNSLLDIGTGTGILAMVALKNDAQRVKAIDIGDLSVKAARSNLKINRLNAVVKEADIKTFRDTPYDCVAANLITHDLIKFCRPIVRLVKPGGYLAVSGISLENLPQLQKAYTRLPLICLQVKKGKQWSALLYQKKMS